MASKYPLAAAERRKAAATGFAADPIGVIALGAFFFLTFGFFTYQTALSYDLTAPRLGGFSTFGAILVLPFVLVCYVLRATTTPGFLSRWDALFFAFVALFVTVSGYAYLRGEVIEISQAHLATSPQFVAWFCVFRLLPFDARWARLPSLGVFGIMTLVMVLKSSTPADVSPLTVDSADVADYQQYAVIYLISLIYILAVLGKSQLRFGVYVVAIAALFLNGARSEFIIFPLILLSSECFRSLRLSVFVVGALVTLLFMGTGIADSLIDLFPNNRFTYLLENSGGDVSVLEREYLIQRAILTISERPIMGNYADYLPGEYTHNILSVWVDFGIFGFLLFTGALLACGASAFGALRERRDTPLSLALVCFSVAAIGLYVFAKYWTYPMFPIVTALAARRFSIRYAEKMREFMTSHRHPRLTR